MCEVTFSLTTHFPHSVPGRKKKGDRHKDLDVCNKVASENECLITDIHKPEQPLSKIELRQRKLETRKKRNLKCIEEIQDGKWLKDSHIKRASDLLKAQFPSVLGLYDPILGEDLSFPITKAPFVQILHTGGSHWLTVEGVTPSVARIYDSMYYTTSTTTQLQIAAIMCCEAGSITLKVENMHLQNGGSDCGVFAIAYATDLCYGNCPSTLQYCQDRLRAHLIRCLKSKHMIPFPSRCRRPGKPHVETISVYCSCRLPESDDEKMAACDKCGEWYHLSCAKIPPEVFKNSKLPWMCSKCQM